MASKDLLLVLRAPLSLSPNSHANASGGPSAAYTFVSDQYWALIPPPLQQEPRDHPHSNHGHDSHSHMVLVKLADRDDILVDKTDADPPRPATLRASVAAAAGVDAHKGDERAAQGTADDAAMDAEIQQDIEHYLEDSLRASLGLPEPYNPMLYTSNTVNNMVSRTCAQFLSTATNDRRYYCI